MARNAEKTLPAVGPGRSIDEWRGVVRSLSGRTPKQVIARERVLAIKDDILAARARGVSAVELARVLGWSAAIHHPPVNKAIADALVGKLTNDREYKLLGDPRHLRAHIIYHDRPARLGDDGCWRFARTKARIGGARALMELRERIAAVINVEIERDGRSHWRVSGKNYRNLGVDVTPLKYESDKVYRAHGRDLAAIRATSYSAGVNDGAIGAAEAEQLRDSYATAKRRERAEALARGEARRRAREDRARDREFRQRFEERLPATAKQIEAVRALAGILDVAELVDEAVFISRFATTGLVTMLQATQRDMARTPERENVLRQDLRERLITGQRVVAALRRELAQADHQVRSEKEARLAAQRRGDTFARDLGSTLQHVDHLVDQLERADQQLAQERQIGRRLEQQIRLLEMEIEKGPREAKDSAEAIPVPSRNRPEPVFVIEKTPGFGTRQVFLGEPKPGDQPIATTRSDALDRKLAELAAERGIEFWSVANYSDKTISEARQAERRQVEDEARAREQHFRAQAAAERARRTEQMLEEARRSWQAQVEAQRLDQAEIDARVEKRVAESLARQPVLASDPPATATQVGSLFAMLAERGCHLKSSNAPVTATFADELIGHLQQVAVKSPPLKPEPPQPLSAQAVQSTGIVPLKRPRDGGIDGI